MKKRTTEFFIFVFTALAFSYFSTAKAGTCSSITRSSFGANTVLTSAELNSQFSTVYSATNDLDAGCLTDGTLEASALNSSDFQPLLNNVIGGCFVSRSSVSAVSISPCSISINGNMVYKSGATVVSMGCGDCSAETASTVYYVYIKGDSSGSTINAFLSTTQPDSLGNNGTARVIARLTNDSSSDIMEYSIDQWNQNRFIQQETGLVDGGTITINGVTADPAKGATVKIDDFLWSRQGPNGVFHFQYSQQGTGTAGTGDYLFTLPSGLRFASSVTLYSGLYPHYDTAEMFGSISVFQAVGLGEYGEGSIVPYNATQFRIMVSSGGATTSPYTHANMGYFIRSATWGLGAVSPAYKGTFTVPIEGFQY